MLSLSVCVLLYFLYKLGIPLDCQRSWIHVGPSLRQKYLHWVSADDTSRQRVSNECRFVHKLLVVDSQFYVPNIVCGGSGMVLALLCITLCPFQF